jgi:peptidoglycan-associated lipoprotein
MNSSIRLLAVALTIVSLSACNKAVKPMTAAGGGDPVAPMGDKDPEAGGLLPGDDFSPTGLDRNPCLMARTVKFDLDRTEISGEFSEMIGCHAKFLTMNAGYKLTLGGNADERGTREYNLGLGERRNNAVMDMLKAKGASGGQIEGVSYGEEQPTCTESNESCWANNRRVEFTYSK